MADIKETWDRHAKDIIAGNMAGLMGDFTPNGMTKAMAIAANPLQASSFELNDLGGGEVEITYVGDKRRTIWSKWVENAGNWQIDDLAERA